MDIILDKFVPRHYQQAICDAFEVKKYKKILVVWPRRAGKDIVAFNLMIRAALLRVGVYFYCLPTFKQARLVIWDSITNDGQHFTEFIPIDIIDKKNESEMKITLKNGSIIQMIGSDTYDTSLVGTNAVMIVFSEFALADPQAYHFVRPLLNANDGSVIILSTPRAKNFFYDMYKIAQKSDDWFCEKLTVDNTKHISVEAIQKEIDSGEISWDLAQQEYWTSFEFGQEGTVYGKYLQNLSLKGRITKVPYDASSRVHTAWDLGVRDCTVIIFFQVIGTAVHIIDYYEQNGQGFSHYAKKLDEKGYVYGKHFAPHDIKVREQFSTDGMTRLEKAREFGVNFTLAPHVEVEDGIEAVRTLLPRCYFDEDLTKQLIRNLETYHYEFDSKRNVYSRSPVHDFSSHGCDAFRYLALSIKKLQVGLTPEDIERNYQEARLGNQALLPQPFRNTGRYY